MQSLDVLLFLVLLVLVGGWLLLAGDREGAMTEEEQTLDVQNHEGDE